MKYLVALLVSFLCSVSSYGSAPDAQLTWISVNGVFIERGFVSGGVTYAPVHPLADALGASFAVTRVNNATWILLASQPHQTTYAPAPTPVVAPVVSYDTFKDIKSVNVVVEDFYKDAESHGWAASDFKSEVELHLREAGLVIDPLAYFTVYVNVLPIQTTADAWAASYNVYLQEGGMNSEFRENVRILNASIWNKGGILCARSAVEAQQSALDGVAVVADSLANAWLASNPKSH